MLKNIIDWIKKIDILATNGDSNPGKIEIEADRDAVGKNLQAFPLYILR